MSLHCVPLVKTQTSFQRLEYPSQLMVMVAQSKAKKQEIDLPVFGQSLESHNREQMSTEKRYLEESTNKKHYPHQPWLRLMPSMSNVKKTEGNVLLESPSQGLQLSTLAGADECSVQSQSLHSQELGLADRGYGVQ